MADISSQVAQIIAGAGLTDAQIEMITRNLSTLRLNALLSLDEDVSRAKEGSRVTKAGFDIMAKGVSGKEIKYTRMALGDSTVDGEFVDVPPEEGVLRNSLLNERLSLPIAECAFSGGGTFTVKGVLNNVHIEEGFYTRELGLFALDPDTGEEVMYAYRNTGLASGFLPGGDGAIIWNVILTLITVIDSATNVTAVIDGSLAFVSQTEFINHINSTHPHPNTPQLGDEVTTTDKAWATDNDLNLHPISIDNLRRLILEGEASTVPQMDRRIGQLEINVANLYTQAAAEDDMGFKPNLLLVEDFTDTNHTDNYSCKVTAQVAGVNGFQLESDQNILNGHWYTITDGINSEYVQVKSVARNDNVYVVIIENQTVNTYNLANTTFLRTTTLINDGSCEGAGDLRGTTIQIGDTWQGSSGNVLTELPLNTTQANSINFDVTGNGGFNANGEFTIVA